MKTKRTVVSRPRFLTPSRNPLAARMSKAAAEKAAAANGMAQYRHCTASLALGAGKAVLDKASIPLGAGDPALIVIPPEKARVPRLRR